MSSQTKKHNADDVYIEVGRTEDVRVNLSMVNYVQVNAYLSAIGNHPVIELLSYGGRAALPMQQVEDVIELMRRAVAELEAMNDEQAVVRRDRQVRDRPALLRD